MSLSASFRHLLFFVAILLAGMAPSVASAQIVVQRGWESMCARGDQPIDICRSHSGPREIAYTEDVANLLSQTNAEINGRYRFRNDSGGDYWTVPTGGTADCEDYVMAKMLQLKEAGIPMSTMVLLIEHLRNGAWHVRLGVRTDAGTVLLDSLERDTSIVAGYGRVDFYLDMGDARSWRVAG